MTNKLPYPFNDIVKKLEQIDNMIYYLDPEEHIPITSLQLQTNKIRKLICQVKETLSQLDNKLKTLDQKEENQEDQPEPNPSPQHNDQTSPEKEQTRRTARTSSKYQFVILYPIGESSDCDNGKVEYNCDMANKILDALVTGKHITIPNTFTVIVLEH